jgi:hypothetical protein
MWSEDTDIGDVATLRGSAIVFLRRADTAKSPDERDRYLQYAKLYQDLSERAEAAAKEDDDDM